MTHDYYPRRGGPRLAANQVNQAASGRWVEILTALGLPDAALTKRNKPCPGCGGRDKFSFIDDGRGAFVCRGMDKQGGDGLALLQHVYGWDFPQALLEVAKVLGMPEAGEVDRASVKVIPLNRPHYETPPPKAAKNEGAIRQLWLSSRVLTGCEPAALYLKGRGLIVPVTETLRCMRLVPYWHPVTSPTHPNGKPTRLGQYPALIAKVSGPDGELVGVHTTYVTAAGQKLRLDDPDTRNRQPVYHPTNQSQGFPVRIGWEPLTLPAKKLRTVRDGAMRGAAIRLFAPDDNGLGDGGKRLAVAEGIETAIAAHMMSGLPVWACVSAFGLEHVVLPPDVTDLWVFADKDRSNTGRAAGMSLLRRAMAAGVRVRFLDPDEWDTDWCDVLNDAQRDGRFPLPKDGKLGSR
jgi:putative DNA primase/helicase